MFYEVTGIKEQNEESINIHFLIEQEGPGAVRNLLQGHDIIILWIKEAMWEEGSFGPISCTISENNKETVIIVKNEELFAAAEFLFELWFEVIDINFIKNPESVEKIAKILSDAKDQIQSEVTQKQLEITEQKEVSKKVYQDKELKKLQTILDEIFEYLTKLYPKIEWVIIPERIQRLRQLEETLKKLRMWRNSIKIKEVLNILFKLLEKIQLTYFEKAKKDNKFWSKLFEETQVLERELIQEYQKFKRSETIKALNIKQSKEDKYYVFLEKNGIYRRFLKKDLLQKLKNKQVFGYKFFDFAEFILIVICVELGLYVRVQELLFSGGDTQHIFIILLHIGILALLLFAVSFLKKKNLWRLFLLLLIRVAAYFLISTLVTTNFWL